MKRHSFFLANIFRLRNVKEVLSIHSIEGSKEVMVNMEEILEPRSECCIYRVPKHIREANDAAYTPRMVSIGPLHHGKPEFSAMEKQKIRYKREFSKRLPAQEAEEKWQRIVGFLGEQEQRIRKCYDETFDELGTLEFITMVLYDSVFLIEFLLRGYSAFYLNETLPRDPNLDPREDFLLDKGNVYFCLWLDMQLFENQLPYFVLEEIYKVAFPNANPAHGHDRRLYPSLFLISYHLISGGNLGWMPGGGMRVKHLTDIRRHLMTTNYQPRHQADQANSAQFLTGFPCAVKLNQSGVGFASHGENSLDIRFLKIKRLGLRCFGVSQMQIPSMELFEQTDAFVRNVMAFEQCCYPSNYWHICKFYKIMDFLIDNEDDVDLLVEAGVLRNNLPDSFRVVKMFNNLCHGIDIPELSNYHDVIADVKAHYHNPWNHKKATLKMVYFSNLWRGTGTVAAIVLLLLTLIQAVSSVISVMCSFRKC